MVVGKPDDIGQRFDALVELAISGNQWQLQIQGEGYIESIVEAAVILVDERVGRDNQRITPHGLEAEGQEFGNRRFTLLLRQAGLLPKGCSGKGGGNFEANLLGCDERGEALAKSG